MLSLDCKNEQEVNRFSRQLAVCAKSIDQTLVVYLQGNLGAGKTTFARNFIQFFGFKKVKSPTYSLVESYENQEIIIHHFDCYRLSDPEELEYIGIREYSKDTCIQLIEWAEFGENVILPADLTIDICDKKKHRILTLTPHTLIGNSIFSLVQQLLLKPNIPIKLKQ